MQNNMFLIQLLLGFFVSQYASAEMIYSPTLPQFDGGNGQALGIVQFEKRQIDSRNARADSALASASRLANKTTTTNADRLISSITNYLNVKIARRFANEVLSGDAPRGIISVGNVSIGYVRSDGFLSVEIDDRKSVSIIELHVVQ